MNCISQSIWKTIGVLLFEVLFVFVFFFPLKKEEKNLIFLLLLIFVWENRESLYLADFIIAILEYSVYKFK